MLNFLWSLFIGGVLGLIAGAILGKEVPGGVSGNIIIGFLGSWLGEFLLGPLGPELGGFYLIPALLGAIFALRFIHLWQDVSGNDQRKNNFIQIS